MNIDAGLMNPLEYINPKAAIKAFVVLIMVTDMANVSFLMTVEKSTLIWEIMSGI